MGTSATVFLHFIADKHIPSVRFFQKRNSISFHYVWYNRYFKIFSVYQFRMLAHHNWQIRVHECSSLQRLSTERGRFSQAVRFLVLTFLKSFTIRITAGTQTKRTDILWFSSALRANSRMAPYLSVNYSLTIMQFDTTALELQQRD
jgi:hypothetical protein